MGRQCCNCAVSAVEGQRTIGLQGETKRSLRSAAGRLKSGINKCERLVDTCWRPTGGAQRVISIQRHDPRRPPTYSAPISFAAPRPPAHSFAGRHHCKTPTLLNSSSHTTHPHFGLSANAPRPRPPPVPLAAMGKGACPVCEERFDARERVPMVSVACGHSICAKCVPSVGAYGASDSERDDDDDRSLSSSSSSARDSPTHCPTCNRTFGVFVKNFDAIDALEAAESARSQSHAPSVRSNLTDKTRARVKASDFKHVADIDLVIERSRLVFNRDPASELGAGASGVVYEGRLDGALVAIKSVRSTSDSWTTADRLRRELKLANRLKHPHIVEFRGAAWDNEMKQGTPRNVLLVTELMGGGNLRTALDATNERGLVVESFLQIALHVARGLVYLHKEGLAHRDIKSANILLSESLVPGSTRLPTSARAKIADFGLSKYIDKVTGGGTVVQSIMEPGRLEATYAYLAPEAFGGDKSNVIRPDDDEDPRFNDMAKKRDIYAFGVLMWEMITGHIPWAGVSLPDVYVRVCVRSDRPCPGLEDQKVPKYIRRLVERCWSQSPHRRPSASYIVSRLEKIAAKLLDTSRSASASASASAAVTNVTVGDTLPNPAAVHRTHSNHQSHGNYQHGAPPTVQPPHPALPPSGGTSFIRTGSHGTRQYLPHRPHEQAPVAARVSSKHNMNEGIVDDHLNDEEAKNLRRSLSAANPRRHSLHSNDFHNAAADHHDNLVHPNLSNLARAKRSGRSLNDDGPTSRHVPPSTALPPSNGGQVSAATATAREATAAAIAERMRDNRGAAKNRINREASLPGTNAVADGRPGLRRDLSQPNKMYYDSDEEMRNFDPEQAFADEVYAAVQEKSSTQLTVQTNVKPVHNNVKPVAIQRSTSATIRAPGYHAAVPTTRRPVSPIRRRPMSPAPQHLVQTNSSGNLKEDNTHSLPRNISRVASRNGNDVNQVHTAAKQINKSTSARRFERSASQGTPVVHDKVSSYENRTQTPLSGEPTSGGRNFIRRLKPTEVRTNNKTKGHVPRSISVGTAVEEKRASPTNLDGDEGEVTVMTIGATPREDFVALVDGMSKDELLQNLAKRAHPMRLAGLAHGALSSKIHNKDEEVLRNGCAILHRLTVPSGNSRSNEVHEVPAKEQLSIRRFLKSNSGVQVLLNALQPPRNRHATTLSYAMLALGNLTAWDLDAHKQFREADGVALVAKVMRTHSKNMGVYEKGCYTLACVAAAYSSKMKSVFKKCGAIDVVVSALSCVKQKTGSHDAVTKQACAALGAMCAGCPENAAHAAKSGAITYLIIAFESFRKSSRTESGKRSEMRLVCKAFMDIMCFNENRKMAGSQGGTNLIIRAMRIFRLDSDFVEKVLSTLCDFCVVQETAEQVVKVSGIEDIVAAMVRFRNSGAMQREGGRVLTLLMNASGDVARRLMLHASGGERLVLALEKFGCGAESNANVSVELCKALTALCQVESSVEGDELGRRLRKLRCDKIIKNTIMSNKDNQMVQERGREALKQLSSLRTAGNFWSRLLSGRRR